MLDGMGGKGGNMGMDLRRGVLEFGLWLGFKRCRLDFYMPVIESIESGLEVYEPEQWRLACIGYCGDPSSAESDTMLIESLHYTFQS